MPAMVGVLHYTSSVPHSGVIVGSRPVACYGCGHCVNYMPKGSDRSPPSDADLDVIADQRGECPGKTPNWDAPKQRLELLLRTLPVLQPPLESGLSLLERGCDSSVSVDKSRGLQRRVSNDIEEPVEGFHRGVTFGGNEHQSGHVRTDLMTLT